MPETHAPYDVTATGETYRVVREELEGEVRVGVSSRGRLRFSLPGGTPEDEDRTFVQVYALGFADGQSARAAAVEDHVRDRLTLAAARLGRAIGHLKSGA